MTHLYTRGFVAALTLWLAVGSASDVFAGWRHHGSSGGSSGGYSSGGYSSGGYSSGGWSWGSSGGSSGYRGAWASSGGSWGSSGGSSGGWRHHRRHHHSSGGSWGSSGGYYGSSGGYYGSSGGSSGGYYGGWSGSSSGGSSGGQVIQYYEGAPVDSYRAAPADGGVVPPPPPPAPAPAPMGSATSLDGTLTVTVPEDAQIFVNGMPTASKGMIRQYVSRNLERGMSYSYEVRAVVTRNGEPVEQTKTVTVRPGDSTDLAFDFSSAKKVETALTVHVPENAKVYLAGNPTKATGETRVFRTTNLTEGALWGEYVVRVEQEVNGRIIAREETVTIRGGEQKELRFDMDGEKVADAR